MKRRLLVVLVGVTMLTMVLPMATANHFSVGGRDSIGTEASETPETRSVEGLETAVEGTPYGVGTSTDCYEASGELSQEEADSAMAKDPFCGQLVYHADNPDLRHESPPDQDLRSTSEIEVGTFDVILTNVADAEFFACTPFCTGDPQGAGDLAWDAVHTVGAGAGLTDGPDEADEGHSGDDGTSLAPPNDKNTKHSYGQGVSFHFPTATYLIQQETDLWEMNGWWSPAFTAKNFVAYLYDDGGDPIGIEDLEEAVPKLSNNGELPDEAKPSVCGWTPDFSFTSLNFEGSACEIKFEYREPTPQDANFKDDKEGEDYDSPCMSPAWVCGAFSGPAWYSRAWYPTGGSFGTTTTPDDGMWDYTRWHFFVAGHPSECGGTQEPGYSFTAEGSDHPYLAHELEVYTKPTDLSSTDTTQEVGNLQDFSWEGASQTLSDVGDTLPGVPENPVENPADVEVPSSLAKDERVEPNAEPVGSIEDTSQSLPTTDGPLQRDLGDFCDEFLSNEDSDTVDPWVDIIDGQVKTEDQSNGVDGLGLYGNSDENQDENNHPGPNLYRTDGNVGMFTDKDDDGEYETLSGNPTVLSSRSQFSLTADKYTAENIKGTGAYPMLWDMWVTDDLQIDENEGCSGITGQPFSAEMDAAGYGSETALFQAVYLAEPTAFVYSDTGDVAEYPGGDNIYLLLSQSARAHYDADTTAANDVDEQIDEAVSELRSTVASGADVQIPGDQFGLDSDFMTQCDEDTGGFTLEFSFLHNCELGCSGDTIVTGYTFEVTRDDGTLGGEDAETVPEFTVSGDGYDFGPGQHTWFDVDPFDNDPSRNDDTDDRPPTG